MTTAAFTKPQPKYKCRQANEAQDNCLIDTSQGEVYLAGQIVDPGTYRQIDVGRVVTLLDEGVLPGSLDGRVACYERLPKTWGEMKIRLEDGKH